MIDAALGRLFDPIEEFVERADEIGAFFRRKGLVDGDTVAPWRQRLVDLEIKLAGDLHERIVVGGVQPAAAEIEGNARRRRDGVAASTGAVARFQDDERATCVL